MQEKLEEAHAAIIKEKEAARIAIEQAPPVIKEVPVVDNTKLELLTNRNTELEVKNISMFHYSIYLTYISYITKSNHGN